MKINASADSGLGYNKGKTAAKFVTFPNYIRSVEPEELDEIKHSIHETNEDNLLVRYDNKYYVLGTLACDAYPETTRRTGLNSRIKDVYHLVQILTTVGLLCDDVETDVNLGTALPNSFTYDDKVEMSKWLKNTYDIDFIQADKEIHKKINMQKSICVNQPAAIVYSLQKSERDKSILIVDIGHGTTDILVWMNKQIVQGKGAKISVSGVKSVYGSLRLKLLDKYKDIYGINEIFEKDIQKAVETKMYRGDDISDLLKECLDAFADEIMVALENNFDSYLSSCDNLMITGGIMNNQYFADKIAGLIKAKYSIEPTSIDSPQKAVVNGIYNILAENYKDDYSPDDDERGVA